MLKKSLTIEGYEDIKVDSGKLNRIQRDVIVLEQKNLKTKELTKSEMRAEILKIIREEVNKNI